MNRGVSGEGGKARAEGGGTQSARIWIVMISGIWPLFMPALHRSQTLWKHQGWKAQALIYVWTHSEVMRFSCSTALSCFIWCLLSDCSIIIMAITTNREFAQWGYCLLTQLPAYWKHILMYRLYLYSDSWIVSHCFWPGFLFCQVTASPGCG